MSRSITATVLLVLAAAAAWHIKRLDDQVSSLQTRVAQLEGRTSLRVMPLTSSLR